MPKTSINKDFLHNITVTTNNSYDTHGNLTNSTTDNGTTQTIKQITYTTAGGQYNYLPQTVTTTQKRSGEQDYVRTQTFEYFSNGALKKQITDPNTDLEIATSYEYETTYGNPNKTIISPNNMQQRIATIQYDDKGRFPIKKTNPKGFSVYYVYDDYGNLLQETSPNGLVTKYKYDSWGNLKNIMPKEILLKIIFSGQ